MKICINQSKYSVTAATSPITVEAGQWRGETSDATPENKKNNPNQKTQYHNTCWDSSEAVWQQAARHSKSAV